MPSRRQTRAAVTATSTPIMIIDQPIGFADAPGTRLGVRGVVGGRRVFQGEF